MRLAILLNAAGSQCCGWLCVQLVPGFVTLKHEFPTKIFRRALTAFPFNPQSHLIPFNPQFTTATIYQCAQAGLIKFVGDSTYPQTEDILPVIWLHFLVMFRFLDSRTLEMPMILCWECAQVPLFSYHSYLAVFSGFSFPHRDFHIWIHLSFHLCPSNHLGLHTTQGRASLLSCFLSQDIPNLDICPILSLDFQVSYPVV